MKKLFISGSISKTSLDEQVRNLLDMYIHEKFEILVGDANGIDSAVQNFFSKRSYFQVVVYTIYRNPRNLLNNKFKSKVIIVPESIRDERKRQTKKDEEMTNDCDCMIVIWDGKSRGSYNNIIRGLTLGKVVEVFLDGERLSRNEVTIKKINKLYEDNHFFSLTEYHEKQKSENKSNFKSAKDIKLKLIELGVIEQTGKILDEVNKDNMTIEFNRGREIYKYRGAFLDRLLNNKVVDRFVQGRLL